MKANENSLSELVESLRESCGLSRLVVASHKSYIRVLEVSKSQASRAEACEALFKLVKG